VYLKSKEEPLVKTKIDFIITKRLKSADLTQVYYWSLLKYHFEIQNSSAGCLSVHDNLVVGIFSSRRLLKPEELQGESCRLMLQR
jgi:hypothetical protein